MWRAIRLRVASQPPLRAFQLKLNTNWVKVPDAAIDEFKELYEQEFGEKLSRVEAVEIASNVLLLYRLLSRALPEYHVTQPDGDHRPIGFRA